MHKSLRQGSARAPVRQGGLFGWIGIFSNKELDIFRACATNRYKCVLLELEDKTVLVTPESPDELVASAQTLIQE